jgi:hypothetical protein
MTRIIPVVVLVGALGGVQGLTATAPIRAIAPVTTVEASSAAQVSAARGVIPAGQELDVRLDTPLSSETARVEQRFETTTAADLIQDGRVLVPAGSYVRGVVSGVEPAKRGLDRKASLVLSFDQMTVRGRTYPIRGNATSVFKSRGIRDEKGTAGIGAGVGGVLGGVLGGWKGAVVGSIIGAGGAIVATTGKDVDLQPGTMMRVRLDSPVTLR